MILQRVKIAPAVDGVEGLYINGELVEWGDEYHHDIGARIDGWLAAIRHQRILHVYEEWELDDELDVARDYYELGEPMPDNFNDLPEGLVKREPKTETD